MSHQLLIRQTYTMRTLYIFISISMCVELLMAQEDRFYSTLDPAGVPTHSRVDFMIQPSLTKPGKDAKVVNVTSSHSIIKWKEWDFTESVFIRTPGKDSTVVLFLSRPRDLKSPAGLSMKIDATRNLSSNGRLLIRFVD